MKSIRKTVLIVDDSDADRGVLKNILRNGFNVLEAPSGFAALNVISEKKKELDAIFLDISMPVLDGFTILESMKEKKITNICVFMITSEATKENVEKAAGFHIAGFIKKPYDADDIIERVKQALGDFE